jgi:hypothetical protein
MEMQVWVKIQEGVARRTVLILCKCRTMDIFKGAKLHKYCADNNYNACETGLFYRATPTGSLSYKHRNISGSKKGIDCVTVLCC